MKFPRKRIAKLQEVSQTVLQFSASSKSSFSSSSARYKADYHVPSRPGQSYSIVGSTLYDSCDGKRKENALIGACSAQYVSSPTRYPYSSVIVLCDGSKYGDKEIAKATKAAMRKASKMMSRYDDPESVSKHQDAIVNQAVVAAKKKKNDTVVSILAGRTFVTAEGHRFVGVNTGQSACIAWNAQTKKACVLSKPNDSEETKTIDVPLTDGEMVIALNKNTYVKWQAAMDLQRSDADAEQKDEEKEEGKEEEIEEVMAEEADEDMREKSFDFDPGMNGKVFIESCMNTIVEQAVAKCSDSDDSHEICICGLQVLPPPLKSRIIEIIKLKGEGESNERAIKAKCRQLVKESDIRGIALVFKELANEKEGTERKAVYSGKQLECAQTVIYEAWLRRKKIAKPRYVVAAVFTFGIPLLVRWYRKRHAPLQRVQTTESEIDSVRAKRKEWSDRGDGKGDTTFQVLNSLGEMKKVVVDAPKKKGEKQSLIVVKELIATREEAYRFKLLRRHVRRSEKKQNKKEAAVRKKLDASKEASRETVDKYGTDYRLSCR